MAAGVRSWAAPQPSAYTMSAAIAASAVCRRLSELTPAHQSVRVSRPPKPTGPATQTRQNPYPFVRVRVAWVRVGV
jgi:hypothetical protein